MQYRVLRGFVLSAASVDPGAVVSITDESLVRVLLARGCITPYTATGAAPAPSPNLAGGAGTAGVPDEVAVREPEPENREPRTPRRTRE